MATPVHVPRINNNDDEVRVVSLDVAIGDRVEPGRVLAQVETDKAVVEVEAAAAGFVLAIRAEVDAMATVGTVLLWLGETADEPVPQDAPGAAAPGGGAGQLAPTAKAAALLREHGLSAADVPSSGERLSVADVQRFVAQRGAGSPARTPASSAPAREPEPEVPATARALSGSERGMLATVTWHRDVAVPGYIEIEFDPRPWEEFAKAFADKHKLLFSPMLPLMAQRLIGLAREKPALNATIVDTRRLEYVPVNLGFTVQAGEVLYLTVLRGAEALSPLEFCQAMLDLQKRATVHTLGPTETSGATIGFSSMARWKVARHIPVLAPSTSFMVAHTAIGSDRAVLGATYDHRVLNGFHVVSALRKLSTP